MFIQRTPQANYPFTASSSMLIASGIRLGAGVIKSALLYPAVDGVAYAQIAEIGRSNRRTGDRHITVVSDTGVFLCEVIFSANSTVGTAYRDSYICGNICGGEAILPFLNDFYTPAPGAFVFTPSVFRPRPTSEASFRLNYEAQPVDSVRFVGGTAVGDLKVSADGTASIIGGTVELQGNNTTPAVKTLRIVAGTTSVDLGGSILVGPDSISGTVGKAILKTISNVNIVPYVSVTEKTPNGTNRQFNGCRLRIVNSGESTITIGAAKDV